MHVLEFAPPMSGFSFERFNTIRLGRKWASRLNVGDSVLLMDKPNFWTFGEGRVTEVIVGRVKDILPTHAAHNHNQIAQGAEGAQERAIASMKKRYGPHKVGDNSFITVIYLRVKLYEDDLSRRLR